MPRLIFIFALASTLFSATTVLAQESKTPSIDVSAGFSSQSSAVEAKGQHNMADSATLKEQGCQGYVATAPSVVVNYDAKGNSGALIVRASGADDLVLLIGTASSTWHCAAGDENTPPEVELPPGSGAFSVWVGVRTEDERLATLTISEKTPTTSNTSCGGSKAHIPSSIAPEDWENYSCQSEATAQDAWSQCQPRTAYSSAASDGCPGAQRCCPPLEGDDAPVAAAPDKTGGKDDESFYAEYSLPPIGNVAEGGPDQLIVETNPYSLPDAPIRVHWRGFDSAEIPVRATTTKDGKTMFTLLGEDFPQEVTDSLLVITQTRTLRATKSVKLSTKSTPISLSSGARIDLLAQIDASTCAVRIDGKQQTASCPNAADFEGVSAPFDGWSPLNYEWWVAVEDAEQQRGWVHIDRQRPEFFIEINEGATP